MIKDIRVGFTAGTGIISHAIRMVDRADVDGVKVPSAINHVLLRVIYQDGMDFVFQSHGNGGVGICFTNDIKRAISDGKVFRYADKSLGLNQQLCDLCVSRMMTFTGAGYDQLAILAYYLSLALKIKKASEMHDFDRYTCNEAVIKVLSGMVSWANSDVRPTPEPIFAAVFQCQSPVYFKNNPSVPLDFWP